MIDKGLELQIEIAEFGVMGDVVEGLVVAVVALILPDVYSYVLAMKYTLSFLWTYQMCQSRRPLFASFQPG